MLNRNLVVKSHKSIYPFGLSLIWLLLLRFLDHAEKCFAFSCLVQLNYYNYYLSHFCNCNDIYVIVVQYYSKSEILNEIFN